MLDLPLPFRPVMELKLSSLCASQSFVSTARLWYGYTPTGNDGAHGVRLEAVDDDFDHPHLVVTGAGPLLVLESSRHLRCGMFLATVLFTMTLFTTDARREAAADRTPPEPSHVKQAFK